MKALKLKKVVALLASLVILTHYAFADIAPEHAQAYNDFFQNGNELFFKQEYDDAADSYKKALELNPTCAHSCFNLGQAYFYGQRYQEALDSFKKTIALQPTHAFAYSQIGKILYDHRYYDNAITILEQALAYNPNIADAYLILGKCYDAKEQYATAVEHFKKGLEVNPDHIDLLFQCANVLNTLNQLDESLSIYKRLDTMVPNNSLILYNTAFTLKKLHRLPEALEFYDKALELDPTLPDAWFSRGLAYLTLGDFEKGWEGYEWRYHKPDQGSLRSYTQPRWDGQDLNGKRIFIHSEQGLGDTFQFIRYALELKRRGAYVIAAVQKPLIAVMKLLPYLDEVVENSPNNPLPEFDFQAPIMSLPFLTKTTIDTIPSEFPYIFADEKLVQEWAEKLSADRNYRIGVCWQGNSNYATPTLRTAVALKSIKAAQFEPICSMEGVTAYSLQKETGMDQLNALDSSMSIVTFDETFDQANGRFMDTLAVMRNMDLIITVDTSVCHAAAALGIETWVLLPNPADWRWMLDRLDTPWYPTMRLFRQPTPGDWDSVLAQITCELAKRVQQSNNQ